MKTILVDAVNTFISKEGEFFEDVASLVAGYENPKIILTNADDEQVEEFGLTSVPYEVFSLKHNPDKVDPKYFESMLEHFGFTKDDMVYFEHNEAAVESARSIGITTFHFDKEERDIAALKDFLDSSL